MSNAEKENHEYEKQENVILNLEDIRASSIIRCPNNLGKYIAFLNQIF